MAWCTSATRRKAASAESTISPIPYPTPNDLWLPNICRLLDVTGVELVDQSAFDAVPPTRMEALFQKQMAFYYMYLQGEPRFDCSRTLEALQGTGIECPRVTVEFIERMVGWYVEYLKSVAGVTERVNGLVRRLAGETVQRRCFVGVDLTTEPC